MSASSSSPTKALAQVASSSDDEEDGGASSAASPGELLGPVASVERPAASVFAAAAAYTRAISSGPMPAAVLLAERGASP
jgi:hypothetical protein